MQEYCSKVVRKEEFFCIDRRGIGLLCCRKCQAENAMPKDSQVALVRCRYVRCMHLRTLLRALSSSLILPNHQCDNQYRHTIEHLHQISGGDGGVGFCGEITKCVFYIYIPVGRKESAEGCYGIRQKLSGYENTAKETGSQAEYVGKHT